MSEGINSPGLDDLGKGANQSNARITYSGDSDSLEKDKQQAWLDEFYHTLNLRKPFAIAIFVLVSVWLIALLVILFMQGHCCIHFQLSEKIMIYLITTTTATVLGYLIWIVRFLFPKPK